MVRPWLRDSGAGSRRAALPGASAETGVAGIARRRATLGRTECIARVATGNVWTPLGPAPLASDATGLGIQDYGLVAGRATAVAVDSADGSGNTVYIGGADGGVWKSKNAGRSALILQVLLGLL